MSENIIYCYTGSGHSLAMAKEIAAVLGDTDIIMMRKHPVKTDATGAKRVGFIFSCLAGGLPGDVEQYIKEIRTAPGAYKFAVEQYALYLGCGLRKIDDIVHLDYWNAVSNHCTAIWLMPHSVTLAPRNPEQARKRVSARAGEIGKDILAQKRSEKKPPKGTPFKAMSAVLGRSHSARVKKFRVSEACISCGICEKICPRDNITLVDKKPVFGSGCFGCLSCVQYCPRSAINIGRITKRRERFPEPAVSAAELARDIIHID